jgi:hypothetical protein
MKGFLNKTERGWFVGPTNDMAGVIYPLHPDEPISWNQAVNGGGEVEYEIVYVDEVVNEYLSNRVHYAKLVNIYADKSDRKVKISAYQKMAENSWEGCDGCTENDKYFYIKGYMAAMLGKEINNSESWGKETGY